MSKMAGVLVRITNFTKNQIGNILHNAYSYYTYNRGLKNIYVKNASSPNLTYLVT